MKAMTEMSEIKKISEHDQMSEMQSISEHTRKSSISDISKTIFDIKIFLADTYALIELLGGNPNYKPYLNHVLITTKFNL